MNEKLNNLKQTILEKCKHHHYDDALDSIDSFLDCFYVDYQTNEHIKLLRKQVELEKQDYLQEQKINNLSRNEFWKMIYHDHLFEISFFEIFLDKFIKEDNTLSDDDLNHIQIILIDHLIDMDIKIYLASFLIDLQLNQEFIIHNNYLNKKISFNPLDQQINHQWFLSIAKQIENHYLKDPSKAKLALGQFHSLANIFFPNPIDASENDIIKSIINMVDHLFDASISLIDNKLIKLLQQNHER